MAKNAIFLFFLLYKESQKVGLAGASVSRMSWMLIFLRVPWPQKQQISSNSELFDQISEF